MPTALAKTFLEGLDEVLVLEELDPVVEEGLLELCARRGGKPEIFGKKTNHLPAAGEYSYELVRSTILKFAGLEEEEAKTIASTATTACKTAGALCRMPAQSFVLCGEASDERAKGDIYRGYRLLYAWEREATGYGGYLPLHGCRYHD